MTDELTHTHYARFAPGYDYVAKFIVLTQNAVLKSIRSVFISPKAATVWRNGFPILLLLISASFS